MLSELGDFDDIPRLLSSSDAELRRRALSMLAVELERRVVRRPWGSIEPFITTLYHKVFVDNDVEAGKLLLDYLKMILSMTRNVLPLEVQEAADIILYAVQAKLEEIDVSSALKQIQKLPASTPVSKLVKKIALIELKGEYDESLDELLNEVSSDIERKLQHLRSLLKEHDSREIVEHFFLDLDLALNARELEGIHTIREYFIHRAKELQKVYKGQKKLVDEIRAEYQELEQRYNMIADKWSKRVEFALPIIVDIVILFLIMQFEPTRIVGGIVTFIFAILFILVRRVRDIIINTNVILRISKKIAKYLARYTKEGRKVLKQLEDKRATLRELEGKIKRFR